MFNLYCVNWDINVLAILLGLTFTLAKTLLYPVFEKSIYYVDISHTF